MASTFYEDFSDLALFAASPTALRWALLVLVHPEERHATRSGGLAGAAAPARNQRAASSRCAGHCIERCGFWQHDEGEDWESLTNAGEF
jgi:hypothetical protein